VQDADHVIDVAFGRHKKDTALDCQRLTLGELFALLGKHEVCSEKDGAYFIAAKFRAPKRDAANIATYSAAVIDIDRDVTPEEIRTKLDGYIYAAYSTYTPGRARIVIPYSQPASSGVNKRVCTQLNALFGEGSDPCTEKAMQFHFMPHRAPDALCWAFHTLPGVK
jgi:hypothetical protein